MFFILQLFFVFIFLPNSLCTMILFFWENLGKDFSELANLLQAIWKQAMGESEAMEMKATLEAKGEAEFKVCTLDKVVTIKKNMVSISKEKKKEHQRVFTPSVIEPSFGIGRIIYCLYEHSFYTRASRDGDEQLNVFRFPPLVAPIKCTVFPLVQNQQYEEVARSIARSLTAVGISYKIDITGKHFHLLTHN